MAKIDADWFRKILTQKNRSQRSMAKHLKLDPGAVTLMLQGKRKMQLDEAREIASFLGEPVAAVLRAAGLQVTGASERGATFSGTPLEQLKQQRAALVAEVEKLDAAISILER
jgi:transcriptional regulator with XRE-family HTH domain